MNNILLENYKKTLKQKFNAVCFDIDGTLTMDSSNEVALESVKMISDLLVKGIPVIFITGRGETGLKELKDKISSYLKSVDLIDSDILSNIYALLNDGAKLCKFDYETGELFGKQELLVDQDLLCLLDEIANEIEISLSSELKKYCNISFSYDSTSNKIINVRVVFDTKDEEIIMSAFSKIKNIIDNKKVKELTLARGFYKNKSVIHVGFSIKDNAIKLTEKMIGIPENSMLRIGDCGDEKGNDFSMLDCSQGFSVDKTSGKNDRCFPVFDKNGKILKGLNATIELINQAKIIRTICLEKVDKKEYIKSYAECEREIIYGRRKYLDEFNSKISKIFGCEEGINDIFDMESGSIKIPMFEWELIDDDNPLKKLWGICDGSNLCYALRDNQNFLLRGSKTYYYLLANRYNGPLENKCGHVDVTSKDNVIQWFENYIAFIGRSIFAVEDTENLNELCNKKLILGLLDNFRNCLLVLINYNLVFNNYDDNLLINLEKIDKNSNIYLEYEALQEVLKFMKDICFSKGFEINKKQMIKLIFNMLKIMNTEFVIVKKEDTLDNYSKIFRAYREIDNFAENYIAIILSSDKLSSENVGVCGISYGGVELPILYKIFKKDARDILILKFNKEAGDYVAKHSIEMRKFDIDDYGRLSMLGVDADKKYVIMDDNILSGKTVQLAMITLYDIGLNTDSVVIVRYPSVNRVDHMFRIGAGAVDYNKFFNFIKGLCFPSPYSWRDENTMSEGEDSLGVFDLNREKILKCLYKNHDYSENSEVDKFNKSTWNCKKKCYRYKGV